MPDSDSHNLSDSAKQLLAIEQLFGGVNFMPARENPLPSPTPQTPAAASQRDDSPPVSVEPLDPADKPAALMAIDTQEVQGCQKCSLHASRTQTVFGEGDPNAKLVFVGEGPGADEDASGRPFVGRAGELLTKMITAMGLSREQVFICNMVKCRPPGNRTPAPEEIQACWNYLIRQLQIIRPKVIVTLGNPATQNLLKTRTGITKLRGQWQKLPDLAPGLERIDVMPTFHPSYVIRRYTADVRGMVWSDLQAVMQHIGLELPKA